MPNSKHSVAEQLNFQLEIAHNTAVAFAGRLAALVKAEAIFVRSKKPWSHFGYAHDPIRQEHLIIDSQIQEITEAGIPYEGGVMPYKLFRDEDPLDPTPKEDIIPAEVEQALEEMRIDPLVLDMPTDYVDVVLQWIARLFLKVALMVHQKAVIDVIEASVKDAQKRD